MLYVALCTIGHDAILLAIDICVQFSTFSLSPTDKARVLWCTAVAVITPAGSAHCCYPRVRMTIAMIPGTSTPDNRASSTPPVPPTAGGGGTAASSGAVTTQYQDHQAPVADPAVGITPSSVRLPYSTLTH